MPNDYLTETEDLSDIKLKYKNHLIVLISGSNFDLSEKEKYNLLTFFSQKRKDKKDILIENELNVTSGTVLIFKKNADIESLIKQYQQNQRYYLKESGQKIVDKVKII